jgi:hypothetical protein
MRAEERCMQPDAATPGSGDHRSDPRSATLAVISIRDSRGGTLALARVAEADRTESAARAPTLMSIFNWSPPMGCALAPTNHAPSTVARTAKAPDEAKVV